MKVSALEIPGLLLIELDVYRDNRGFFMERFHLARFKELGLPIDIAQINHSRSEPRVVRGLHYQPSPPQGKLVGVTRGAIWDVALDIRAKGPTFGRHIAVELSGESGRLLWIPPGFAHGFCVLGNEPADLLYQVDMNYNRSGEGGIRWNDPALQIPWPTAALECSVRDAGLPSLAEYRCNPAF